MKASRPPHRALRAFTGFQNRIQREVSEPVPSKDVREADPAPDAVSTTQESLRPRREE
jgi:hypothetical protein